MSILADSLVLQARQLGSSEECARAGTLDQQQATIERVSKEIAALFDLIEENEAKGRVEQVCMSVLSPLCALV